MTAHEQIDRLLIARAALKGVVADLEYALGVEGALPVTMPTLAAIDAADGKIRELRSLLTKPSA